MVEPRIVGRTLGVRKPDLVLWNESKAYVADVTITSHQVGGAKAHRDKVAYYDQPEIREWVQNITGLTDISFSAVAANWLGVLSPLSADFLKSVLKLSGWEISLLGLRICEESYHIHKKFRMGTYRMSGRFVGQMPEHLPFYLFNITSLIFFPSFFGIGDAKVNK